MHQLIFALAALGLFGGSVSWLSTAYFARQRAQSMRARGLDPAHWHSLAAKDGLTAMLFLCLSIVTAAESAEESFSAADWFLVIALVPLSLSLIWSRRFSRTIRVAASESAMAQRQREGNVQVGAVTERLSTMLDAPAVVTPGGLGVDTFYQPAEGVMGGDFLAAVSEGEEILFAVGDVAGHGFDAAVEALRVKDLLVTAVLAGEGLGHALELANTHLCASELSESLVTAFLGCYRQGELRYASAGHLPGLVFGGGDGAAVTELGPTGLILGVSSTATWEERVVCFPPDHRLVVYTDGLIEAFGRQGGLELDEIERVTRAGDLARLGAAVQDKRPALPRDDIAALQLTRPSRPPEPTPADGPTRRRWLATARRAHPA